MSFIRTVKGDIDPEELGVCDVHDHLIRSGGEEVREDKDFLMDSVDAGKREFKYWLEAGGDSMVCMDPIGCGRNVPKMLEIADEFEGDGHILMTTGFHKAAFYDTRTHWLNTVKDIDKIVEMMVKEIEVGMDYHSYNGPVVERTDAKAGLIKAGTGYGLIHDFELKALRVAALTQQETGCPISVHTQLGTMAYEAAKHLEEFGADLSHVVFCHVQKNPNKYYHKKIMDTGANICYDGPDRVKYYADSVHAENIKWLVEQGYQEQIMLSMDAGRASYQRAYMEDKDKEALGIPYLLERFVPLLEEVGVPENALNDILVNNPKRVLSFID